MSDSYAKADALKAQLDVSEHDLARLLQSAEADADQVRLAVRRVLAAPNRTAHSRARST